MADRLNGKVVLITGAASGIGAAHVRVFAANGAKVVAGDIQDEKGRGVVDEVVKQGGQAAYLHLDVVEPANWTEAVGETVRRFGKLTTLINNAGIANTHGVEAETLEGWNRVVAVDQTAVWLGMKAAIPAMLQAGGGAIVNISSVFGIIGSPGFIAYHGAKGAVRLITKAAALEYARRGIRVNSIHPGIIATPIIESTRIAGDMIERFQAATPMGRMGRPEEIAYGSLYLCSDEASFVTGAELVIDGGWTAQ